VRPLDTPTALLLAKLPHYHLSIKLGGSQRQSRVFGGGKVLVLARNEILALPVRSLETILPEQSL
jgi:hypothetical protein